MAYEVMYPVDFRIDGDKTRDAVEKHMMEFENIYSILNSFQPGVASGSLTLVGEDNITKDGDVVYAGYDFAGDKYDIFGNTGRKLYLKSVDRPQVWLPNNEYQPIAYYSDIASGLPFDIRAHKAVVTQLSSACEIDNDITWIAQWGKIVDITIRYTVTGPADLPSGTNVLRISGVGIVFNNYAQDMHFTVDALTPTFYRHKLIQVGEGLDASLGYNLQLVDGFSIPSGRSSSMLCSISLITRSMFINDGSLYVFPEDFVL